MRSEAKSHSLIGEDSSYFKCNESNWRVCSQRITRSDLCFGLDCLAERMVDERQECSQEGPAAAQVSDDGAGTRVLRGRWTEVGRCKPYSGAC